MAKSLKKIVKTTATKLPSVKETGDIFSPEGLKDFIKFFEKIDISEVEINSGDKSILLSKSGRNQQVFSNVAPAQSYAPAPISQQPVAVAAPSAAAVAVAATPAVNSNLVEIKSPIVGTFYAASDPKLPPLAEVGMAISEGKTVCIIEAMKVFNEIKSEVSGVIREICLKNEQPVEFGQVLFRVEVK